MRQFEIRYTSSGGRREVVPFNVPNDGTGKTLDGLKFYIENKRELGAKDITLYELKNIEMLGKHICGYCGEIADGEDENLLCADCRETFGHAYLDEL